MAYFPVMQASQRAASFGSSPLAPFLYFQQMNEVRLCPDLWRIGTDGNVRLEASERWQLEPYHALQTLELVSLPGQL